MDLLAQFIGLVASQGRGVFQQTLRVTDQCLKIRHQYFLSRLCRFAGHGSISVVACESYECEPRVKVHCNCLVQLLLCAGAQAGKPALKTSEGHAVDRANPGRKKLNLRSFMFMRCRVRVLARQNGSPIARAATPRTNLVQGRRRA
nr:hypothetical protein FFPRI1PSEUD_49760 [Pseudomonas sp. FFPRI_1]